MSKRPSVEPHLNLQIVSRQLVVDPEDERLSLRVADVTPGDDLAAKCHLKREREVYKHVLTLALLDKTYAGKKTKSRGSKVKALFF